MFQWCEFSDRSSDALRSQLGEQEFSLKEEHRELSIFLHRFSQYFPNRLRKDFLFFIYFRSGHSVRRTSKQDETFDAKRIAMSRFISILGRFEKRENFVSHPVQQKVSWLVATKFRVGVLRKEPIVLTACEIWDRRAKCPIHTYSLVKRLLIHFTDTAPIRWVNKRALMALTPSDHWFRREEFHWPSSTDLLISSCHPLQLGRCARDSLLRLASKSLTCERMIIVDFVSCESSSGACVHVRFFMTGSSREKWDVIFQKDGEFTCAAGAGVNASVGGTRRAWIIVTEGSLRGWYIANGVSLSISQSKER